MLALLLTVGVLSPATAISPILQIDGSAGEPVEAANDEIPLVRNDLESIQWHIDAIGARQVSPDAGAGVVVAVLADGVSNAHPDITGRVLPGWDIIKSTAVAAPTTRDPGAVDAGVGTFAAALIAGSADGKGVRGIAPGASILPVVVDGFSAGDATVAKGIDWAVANGADLVYFHGDLAASLYNDRENLTCRAIADARRAGVLTFVAAGNDYDSAGISPKFFAARCSGAVAVAPLSASLSEANGFRNVVTPAFSAPAVRILSAKVEDDWLPYVVNDQAEWAPAIAAAATAVLLGTGLDAESALRKLTESATDLGVAGPDAQTGSGLIDLSAALGTSAPRDEKTALADVTAVSSPRIQTLTSDDAGSAGINWEPPAGVTVTSYRIDVFRWDGTIWKRTSYDQPGGVVRAVVPVELNSSVYLSVTALTASGERVSAPQNSFTITPFENAPNPYAKITSVDARWSAAGISVTVTTNSDGSGAAWRVSVLDGWSREPLSQARVKEGTTHMFTFASESEMRTRPLFVTATINGELVYDALLPQYLIEATGFSAGKRHAAVVGRTDFACMDSINIKSGCEGAEVLVRDLRTKKVIARSWVMSDLSFTVTFPWPSDALKVQVEIVDAERKVRSKPITQGLTYRK
jgi:hypothetical protein